MRRRTCVQKRAQCSHTWGKIHGVGGVGTIGNDYNRNAQRLRPGDSSHDDSGYGGGGGSNGVECQRKHLKCALRQIALEKTRAGMINIRVVGLGDKLQGVGHKFRRNRMRRFLH